MSAAPDWWRQPRRVSVVVDNDGWMLPHARDLVEHLSESGDEAALHCDYESIPEGAVAFYLSCHRVVPATILARHHRNLIAHASDLPRGRGMSPLTWQILEGQNRIPVCLFEAVEAVDAGPVIYREQLRLEGHELIDEMRAALGSLIVGLCRRYLTEDEPPRGEPQTGEPSYWPRRGPEASALDPEASLAAQFELLRVVDNERYPAFFEWRGHRYYLRIDKAGSGGESA